MLLRPILLCALLAGPALAQDGAGVAWGLALTTDYIDRGATQTGGRPAVQAYAEATAGVVYGGIWGSTVNLDDDRAEIDLYLGLRPSLAALDVDLSYTRYLYDTTGDCCGELALALAHPVGQSGLVSGEISTDPEAETLWLEAGGALTLFDAFEADALLGSDLGTLDEDRIAWQLGVARSFADVATLDMRYHDSNLDPARAVVSLSLDF